MIKSIFVFNTQGTPRLLKFYENFSVHDQERIVRRTFELVSQRNIDSTYFFDASDLMGSNFQFVYRHYATLYFVFCVDSAENVLMVLDLIKVFVETLDQYFENVRELDLIFHFDKVHQILNEFVLGGLILELQQDKIVEHIREQEKIGKQETPLGSASNRALFTLRNINLNLPQQLRDFKLPELSSFEKYETDI